MTAQKFEEPKCRQTGHPFYPIEEVHGIVRSVLCSECGEVLLEESM